MIDPARPCPHSGWFQWSFDATGLVNGSVLVEKTGGSGTFGAYGVVDDNVTNDGSILGAVPAGAVSAGTLQLPVLVETPRLLERAAPRERRRFPARVDFTYRESISGTASGTMSVTLAPGEQRILPGAIDVLRKGGVRWARGRGEPCRLGARRRGRPSAPVFAGARTASPSPSGGQFGLFTPAVFPGRAPGTRRSSYGLRADSTNRSNVAREYLGSSDGAITLQLEVPRRGRRGLATGSPVTRRWNPASGRRPTASSGRRRVARLGEGQAHLRHVAVDRLRRRERRGPARPADAGTAPTCRWSRGAD